MKNNIRKNKTSINFLFGAVIFSTLSFFALSPRHKKLIRPLRKSSPINTYACIVLKFSTNIFLIKALLMLKDKYVNFYLQSFIGFAPRVGSLHRVCPDHDQLINDSSESPSFGPTLILLTFSLKTRHL